MLDARSTTLVSLLAMALALAAGPALAQETAPAAAPECFPACRNGYVCHQGACISLCNPPCGEDEKCTPEGECVAKTPAAPPVYTPPVAPAPAPPAPPAPEPRRPLGRKDHGVVFGLTAGAALCASGIEVACNTKKGDAGLHLALRAGYKFLPWLAADVDIALQPFFMKDQDTKDLSLFAGLGARFYPLGQRGRVDPVLGLHLGYAMAYQGVDAADLEYFLFHGLFLGYGIGVDFNIARSFSLGLMVDITEPFWLATCTKTPAEEYNPDTMEGGSAEATSCSEFSGDRDQLLFGLGLSGSFFL